MFPFLSACEAMNCSVVFDNEGITANLKGDDPLQSAVLSIYAHIAEQPKIANDYIKYLTHFDKMDWDRCVHEPILGV